MGIDDASGKALRAGGIRTRDAGAVEIAVRLYQYAFRQVELFEELTNDDPSPRRALRHTTPRADASLPALDTRDGHGGALRRDAQGTDRRSRLRRRGCRGAARARGGGAPRRRLGRIRLRLRLRLRLGDAPPRDDPRGGPRGVPRLRGWPRRARRLAPPRPLHHPRARGGATSRRRHPRGTFRSVVRPRPRRQMVEPLRILALLPPRRARRARRRRRKPLRRARGPRRARPAPRGQMRRVAQKTRRRGRHRVRGEGRGDGTLPRRRESARAGGARDRRGLAQTRQARVLRRRQSRSTGRRGRLPRRRRRTRGARQESEAHVRQGERGGERRAPRQAPRAAPTVLSRVSRRDDRRDDPRRPRVRGGSLSRGRVLSSRAILVGAGRALPRGRHAGGAPLAMFRRPPRAFRRHRRALRESSQLSFPQTLQRVRGRRRALRLARRLFQIPARRGVVRGEPAVRPRDNHETRRASRDDSSREATKRYRSR